MANDTNTKDNITLESGTYEIIRDRLLKHGEDLRKRISKLNESRKEVFGSIETQLVSTERISTENNCIARDIVPLGQNRFLFGYNVHMGLKTEIRFSDVFSLYTYNPEDHTFQKEEQIPFFDHENFRIDFANLYKYYRDTRFAKFAEIGQYIFMVFQVGKTPNDIKTFKWAKVDGGLKYLDSRSDHEFVFPDQHEFIWKKVTRDMQRKGLHPHVSIEDKVFVETVGGDLTIKVENNTDSGRGIYAEEVDDPDQTLDDAEIFYAVIGNLVVLKILPYQETKYRYIVFNQKIQEAIRVDALEDSCVLLPDNQGIIFAKGYYIQTGEFKLFDNQLEDMLFEKRIASPNGEDFLYVFYQKKTGIYALLPYNLINQEVATPIICSGYSIFDDGELIYFRAEDEQKRHHSIQIWQTPFYSPNKTIEVSNSSYLFKIGNKEVVRAMAEASELVKLINKEDNYANLYVDLVKMATDVMDTYHWLSHKEACELRQPLQEIKKSASTAIEEYEKVIRIKKDTRQKSDDITAKADDIISRAKRGTAATIDEFVERLAQLRTSKGEIISLKELRYIDNELIAKYEQELSEITNLVSERTVHFLLKKEALQPYRDKVEKLNKQLEKVKKVVEANELEKEIVKVSGELELLIDIVSNLKIEDATQTTRIIDGISAIYSQFNRINAALKKRRKELIGQEGEAEFNSQLKLINQGLTNYLDICDTPEKCEEYLNKLMVQLEELEGKFAEFDKFLAKITEKREEVYNAFESKKVYLTEAKNKKSLALQQSAERIVSGIQKRLSGMDSVQEINSYYASDLMVDKVRDLSKQLLEMGDSVKADDIQSKLKTAYEEATRQLKDKKELFVDGEDVIRLGKHSFNVNTQNVDLSLVTRNGLMYFHITGTNFFEKVLSEEFMATRDVWSQTLVSEDKTVYRAEYLAYKLFTESLHYRKNGDSELKSADELHQMSDQALQGYVQRRMALRYEEGYIKGVHDKDGMLILKHLNNLHHTIGLLRYPAHSRVLAYLYWQHLIDATAKKEWTEHFKSIASILKVFPQSRSFETTISELKADLEKALLENDVHHEPKIGEAAEYLFHFLTEENSYIFSVEAWELAERFQGYLKKNRFIKEFESSLKSGNPLPIEKLALVKNWLHSYIHHTETEDEAEIYNAEEAALILLDKSTTDPTGHRTILHADISGLQGDHSVIKEGEYHLHYNHFMSKLKHFEEQKVTAYRRYVEMKKVLLEKAREEMRLKEFKPRVMSSFVRNQLLDEVYLPLIGDNLAKQMGAAGDSKRTDLMGMLLLISPPGYGKTTLMEYVANRLGLVFMKINGPAIGHSVTNLDPQSANNSAAREELEKLNLAFEMGDNVMIYVDDIQHCNPEFLQKFISLCDAQRKVEGVYKGVSKTYDLRGKKVSVVMAGNPYTESGEKFQVPDMLANRADIYNLGDIIGGKARAFELSYLENTITSNATTARLSGKSQKDILTLIKVAETGNQEGIEFEANHSPEEISEYVNLLKKMIRIRDIILKVNEQYIRSAGMSPEFRTEPSFRLQGSYRDMNKIVEKLSPVMNDKELETIILSHYENESQTLTSGAEFNFLKFKEMFGAITEEEAERKADIIDTFKRNQKLQGLGGNQMGHVLEQMELISRGLQDIVKVFQMPAHKVKAEEKAKE
jgi:MoxR-like ATPase